MTETKGNTDQSEQTQIFLVGGLKETGAKMECFRQRVNTGILRWTV